MESKSRAECNLEQWNARERNRKVYNLAQWNALERNREVGKELKKRLTTLLSNHPKKDSEHLVLIVDNTKVDLVRDIVSESGFMWPLGYDFTYYIQVMGWVDENSIQIRIPLTLYSPPSSLPRDGGWDEGEKGIRNLQICP